MIPMQLGEKLPLVLPAVPAGWHCSWKTLPRHTGILNSSTGVALCLAAPAEH
jgi:hypothetical protein